MDCEADTPSDAKEIHSGRDMERPDHAQDNAAIVANEMARYNLVVLGLAKTRWTESDKVKLASGQSIIYSGHEEEGAHHTERVDIMMTKYARKQCMETHTGDFSRIANSNKYNTAQF